MSKLSPATQARLDALDPEQREALAFIPILAEDGVVAFIDGPLTARRVVFRLFQVGKSIVVRTGDGEHLGTYASPIAAALCGYDFLEREDERQRAARSRRPGRRTVKEAQP